VVELLMDTSKLLSCAVEAMGHAHAPYSNYQVGAAVVTESGEVFAGCNVENASYGLTNCAERTAIFSAIAAGHKRIRGMAIVAAKPPIPYPCGACRQVMAEFCDPDCPVLIAPANDLGAAERTTLGSLLPNSFGS
jgi:cytidine deaminase